jgi:hypothetical protein
MRIRGDGRGQAPLIAAVLIIVILIVAAIFVSSIMTWLTPERYDICGTDTESADRLWQEVIIDSLDPGIRNITDVAFQTVQMLLQYYDSVQDLAILVNSDGHDVSIGRAYLYEMGARYFVAIGLFAGCSLTGHAAQGYQKEIQDDTVKLAVLMVLAIAAPQSLSFFPSVEFLINMIFGWNNYLPGSPSISGGPQLQGIEPETLPDSVGEDGLQRQDDEYFKSR